MLGPCPLGRSKARCLKWGGGGEYGGDEWVSDEQAKPAKGRTGTSRIRTLDGPSVGAGPVGPANVLELRARSKVLSVLGLEVQVLVVARVGLDVHTVFAKVKVFDKRVMAVARAFEAVSFAAVNVNLVVHRSYGKGSAIGTELAIL